MGAFAEPVDVMRRALELAAQWGGYVEPNPCVGAVVVDDRLQLISEGAHTKFGGPHAEVVALNAAGERARGATLYVTLEPCAHVGQTPACAPRVIASGIRKVVVCTPDPAPHTAGRGLQLLREAGIEIETELLAEEGRRLIAPFTKLMTRGLPWVHAKWAMTLDGKLATRTGDSKWISSEESRRIVHELRGRMDAIIVGIGTALADDPLLTARPPGPRTPVRIVVDSEARLPLGSQLVRTAHEASVIVAVSHRASVERCAQLARAGVEVLRLDDGHHVPLHMLLSELGQRRMTNVLVEGGSRLLGSCLDGQLIDEVHAFIAPTLAGSIDAFSPIGGEGIAHMPDALRLVNVNVQHPGGDVYVRGYVRETASGE
ncbi:MAG: bifunctional diaminohydroxyphosphoribosylaminopyrimidine deaminase/5-amino-6-(5-phosphoribosylamino)uracil reductase RibD [Planctomycetaceae bacterium]|nr:bifunctional diaminohydroxyphosphoribosylaminopyrimidine deaminase/5-amino-6-(5-phosphoribosylamino)uracil reductase RibD [Planctomycetaceae bacterium]